MVKSCSVNYLREDFKGQNLVQYAAKFKLFAVVEYLMGIGVPCPADIKRKVERNNNKFGARIKREDDEEGLSGNKGDVKQEYKTPSEHDTKIAMNSLTTFQQRDFQKLNGDNKLNKKYCLTRLKDGVYQEVTMDDFEEFCQICPEIKKLLDNPELVNQIAPPKLMDSTIPLFDHWDKAAKRLINQLWRCNACTIFHKPVDPDKLSKPPQFDGVTRALKRLTFTC